MASCFLGHNINPSALHMAAMACCRIVVLYIEATKVAAGWYTMRGDGIGVWIDRTIEFGVSTVKNICVNSADVE
jgi:hypothetical protein